MTEAVAQEVRAAAERTRETKTASVRYSRKQDVVMALMRNRRKQAPRVLRWICELLPMRVIKKRSVELASRWEQQQATGTVDFNAHRFLLHYGSFRVMIDGKRTYLEAADRRGWAYSKTASEFNDPGGPLWLFELLAEVVDADETTESDCDHDVSFRHIKADVRPAHATQSDDGVEHLVLDVWLDNLGRVRRLHHSSGHILGSVCLDLSDFGQPPAPEPA